MKRFGIAHWCLSFLVGIALATSVVQAASLEIHPDALSKLPGRPAFADNMVVIDDVGKGGVDYEFMVSATQITVQDWVNFLNAVAPNASGGGLVGDHGSGRTMWKPYEFSGGT